MTHRLQGIPPLRLLVLLAACAGALAGAGASAALAGDAASAASAVAADAAALPPERFLCPVCRVMGGETEEEDVHAVRTYEGQVLGFCSEDCGEAFDADPVAFLPPVFPRPAPPFALTDLAGKPLTSEALRGEVVLLDFWATWCEPCRKSMPELEALHRRFADRGFRVVGVSIDERDDGGEGKVRKFVRSRKITYPIALDAAAEPAWDTYRVKAIPAAFLIDRRGRIVEQWTGRPADAGALEARLEALLAPAAAPAGDGSGPAGSP